MFSWWIMLNFFSCLWDTCTSWWPRFCPFLLDYLFIAGWKPFILVRLQDSDITTSLLQHFSLASITTLSRFPSYFSGLSVYSSSNVRDTSLLIDLFYDPHWQSHPYPSILYTTPIYSSSLPLPWALEPYISST